MLNPGQSSGSSLLAMRRCRWRYSATFAASSSPPSSFTFGFGNRRGALVLGCPGSSSPFQNPDRPTEANTTTMAAAAAAAAAAKRPCHIHIPPLELVREQILPRLPPREPACLLRASLVCKTWAAAISDPAFRTRLHQLHGTPPVLGFLHNWDDGDGVPRFIRTTDSPFALAAAPDCRSWRALDFRHGRALFLSKGRATWELLIWEPITGSSQLLRVPEAFETDHGTRKMAPTAAVLCALDGCDHRDCRGGPFRLVFVFSVAADDGYATSAYVYSSETGTWGEPASMQRMFSMKFTRYSSALVGRSKLYFMCDDVWILGYDLAKHNLTEIDPPDFMSSDVGIFNIMPAEDGGLGLGVCQYLHPNLKLWTKDTDAPWVLSRVINLGRSLPTGNILNPDGKVQLMSFAEGANVVFFNTITGIFIAGLQSQKVRKVCVKRGFCNLIPVVGFYIPVHRGEHQDPSSSGPSEESGSEEEEKTVDQAQQLLDKGSNAIKEGGLVNTSECVSHDTEIRVPRQGEVASDCASMEDKHGHGGLPSEAQQVTDPMGQIPNSALNEELVKSTSTASKDDSGNSKTSGSNVEDAAPTSEKGDSEERVPRHGEVATDCASMEDKHGHDLPSEAQQVTDPMGQVPNSVLNEELVKSTSTSSKDDSGNSKTSDSNVEDPTPTLENGDSEEVPLC
ncbi:uncharacterized protein LOC124680732 [Lolium rigidum]|uniref:uncharacterized protein LOC124680732 n=1 Tax=Lolium rigidum TaxID=89674 RepID=UPI001F5E14DC|nr:uncharacterized protein LOC124680732 [Lolium rigidum]